MSETKTRKPDQRLLSQIAGEIYEDWGKQNGGIYFAAKPYLSAMRELYTIDEQHGCDSAKSIVLYFLGNAQSRRGEVAKRIKAELKAMSK